MMKRFLPFPALIAAIALIALVPLALASGEKEAKAVAAASAWLKLVDDGKYAECWKDASSFLRGAITSQQFGGQLRGARKPLGAVVSRSVAGKQYMTQLPGAPDGEYVIITYKTSFQNKKSATETVTPMLDKDGVWRVSGYYIR